MKWSAHLKRSPRKISPRIPRLWRHQNIVLYLISPKLKVPTLSPASTPPSSQMAPLWTLPPPTPRPPEGAHTPLLLPRVTPKKEEIHPRSPPSRQLPRRPCWQHDLSWREQMSRDVGLFPKTASSSLSSLSIKWDKELFPLSSVVQ